MRISPLSCTNQYSNLHNKKQNASFKKLIVSDEFKKDLNNSPLSAPQKEILLLALEKSKDYFEKMDNDATVTYVKGEKTSFWQSRNQDEILINFPAKRFSGGYYNTSVNIFNQVIENHDSQALSDLIEEKVSRMQRFVYDETGGKNERPKYDCYRDDDEYENMEEFDEGISGTGWDLTDAYIP